MNFGSGDSDAFTYDANTDRITQYKFSVGSQSVVGNLGWNANGTFASLDITDPFDSSNTQNCSYGYDDLVRLASANCGSVFSDTYSYDAFGNLTKSGTFQFMPGYTPANNQMLSGTSYDADGNVTSDGLNSYSWDANGRPTTADGVTLTYDALGRMVEQDNGGTYTEIVWGPTGSKLALMSGQTLQQAFIPLPAGATAVYNSSGLQYYRHADWLGSVRLVSTPTQTVSGDTAYAPFGEPYAAYGTPAYSFTGQNADTASALYDFPAREYGYQGRWPSPDPAGPSAFNMYNPQTLDMYSYTNDDPLDAVDPSGLCPLIVAGIDESPDSPSGKALISYAQSIGANVVFPYANDAGIHGGVWDVFKQGLGISTQATQVTEAAIQASAEDPGGLTSVIAYSGGAQAYGTGASSGPTPANVAYLSPGGNGPLATGSRGTYVLEGTKGFANLLVQTSSSGAVSFAGVPGAQITNVACKHDLPCYLKALDSTGFKAGPACKNPKVFTPQGHGGGGRRMVPPPPPDSGIACVMYWVWDEWLVGIPDKGPQPIGGYWDEQCFTY